jgi:spermidine synthase
MQTWETIDRARAPDGTELVLARRGTKNSEWVVRAAGRVLMSSRVHGSEETLAEYALERVKEPRTVLVGGLGLGFTLRAALDRLPADSRVTVAELVPELAEWNRRHVGDLARRPLDDPRCKLRIGDVFDAICASSSAIDLLLLDVDNGPSALAHAKNNRLYSETGVRACWAALRPGGVLALWSAGHDTRYADILGRAGFEVEVKTVATRPGSGARDVLFLATKSATRRKA